MRYDRSTIDSFYFYIHNPSRTPAVGYTLTVEHDDGLEYPIINSNPMVTYNSADNSFGEEPIRGRTDEFGDVLGGIIVHTVVTRHGVDRGVFYPDKMPHHEKWLIDSIVNCLFGTDTPFEVVEIISRVVDDEPMEVVERVKDNVSKKNPFVNGGGDR